MIIYIADFYRINNEHLVYNASMIEVFSNLPNVDRVEVYGHHGQIELFKKNNFLINKDNINLHPSYVNEKIGGKEWIKKIFYELKSVINLLNGTPKDAFIFFLSLSPITSFFYKMIKVFYKRKRVLVVLHGDLDFIQRNKARLRNLLGQFFILSFKIKDKNTKYVLLSECIKVNLVNTGFVKNTELYVINHPYRFETGISQRKLKRNPIHIGHIGTASEEKNTQLIFELAEHFKHEIQTGKVKFSIIGKCVNIDKYQNQWVNFIPHQQMLAKSEFDEMISTLDYTIFFYKDLNHKFSSSGAILDAINHMVPVISFENQVFNQIFKEAPGEIGYLCPDLDSMKNKIFDLITVEDDLTYQTMVENLKKYQFNYTPKYIENQILNQMSDFVYGK